MAKDYNWVQQSKAAAITTKRKLLSKVLYY